MSAPLPRATALECAITDTWAQHLRLIFARHASGHLSAATATHEWNAAFTANCEHPELRIDQ